MSNLLELIAEIEKEYEDADDIPLAILEDLKQEIDNETKYRSIFASALDFPINNHSDGDEDRTTD